MCGVVDGGIVAGQLGLRSRPERGRGHLRLVHAHLGAGGVRRGGGRGGRVACTSTSPGWPPSSRSASTAWSRWTGTAGTGRCWSTTSSVGAGRRAHAGHQAGGRLPGAARGDGVRHARDRGDLPRQRGAGRGVRGGRRARQERAAHADLRRRHPAAALGHRLRAGSGARLGDPRGGGGGRLPRRTDRGEGHGQGRARASSSPTRRVPQVYDALFDAVPRPARPLRPCQRRRCAGSRPFAAPPSQPGQRTES